MVMKKTKKRVIVLIIICLVVLIGAVVADRILSKEYLVEIKYSEVMKKVKNKDSFILLLSQTTCSHCAEYKPKLKRVSKKYKVYVYYLETDLLKEKELSFEDNRGETVLDIVVLKGKDFLHIAF